MFVIAPLAHSKLVGPLRAALIPTKTRTSRVRPCRASGRRKFSVGGQACPKIASLRPTVKPLNVWSEFRKGSELLFPPAGKVISRFEPSCPKSKLVLCYFAFWRQPKLHTLAPASINASGRARSEFNPMCPKLNLRLSEIVHNGGLRPLIQVRHCRV